MNQRNHIREINKNLSAPAFIPQDRLPTNGDVFRFYEHEKKSVAAVTNKVTEIYESSGIASGSKANLYQKIQRLVAKRKTLVQHSKSIEPLFSGLFPAAACFCYLAEKCPGCLEKHWKFLKDQATTRRMTIPILHLPSRADYQMRVLDDGTPVFEPNTSSSELRSSRMASGPAPRTSFTIQRSPRFVSAPMPTNSSFEGESQSQSTPARKRRRLDASPEVVMYEEYSGETPIELDNSYNTSDIALTAKVVDAYGVSPAVAAHIMNSLLVDLGLMRSDRVITRSRRRMLMLSLGIDQVTSLASNLMDEEIKGRSTVAKTSSENSSRSLVFLATNTSPILSLILGRLPTSPIVSRRFSTSPTPKIHCASPSQMDAK